MAMKNRVKITTRNESPGGSPFQRIAQALRETSRDAIVTWVLFLVMQAVALHFIVDGF